MVFTRNVLHIHHAALVLKIYYLIYQLGFLLPPSFPQTDNLHMDMETQSHR